MNIIDSCTCPQCQCEFRVLVLGSLPGMIECHCGLSFIIESVYEQNNKTFAVTRNRPLEEELMVRNRGYAEARATAPDESLASAARQTAADILDEGAKTYRQRNALYGDSYNGFGKLMKAMFPNGLPDCATVDDFNRLGVFVMMVSKMTRYATNIGTGGHRDSALDLSVYAAMLCELTEEKK